MHILFKLVILLIFSWSKGATAAVSSDCQSALKELFGQEISQPAAAKFLKLQGEITLHRLAWAYLKAQKNDQDAKLSSVEATIVGLLNEKYTQEDPAFIKARTAFEQQPLSRSTLAAVGPLLQEILAREHSPDDKIFLLNGSDVKLLGTLARYETQNSSGQYDDKMLRGKTRRSMLNFIKIINSSYGLSATSLEAGLQIDLKLQGLEKTLIKLQKDFSVFLDDLKLPLKCESNACEGTGVKYSLASLFEQNEDVQAILWESLNELLPGDDLLLENLTYDEIWLKVKTAPGKTTKTVNNQKPPIEKSPPQSKKTSSKMLARSGVLLEDPLEIILDDQPDRKKEIWKNFDQDFLEDVAVAVVKDQKVFLHKGDIFSRKTGRKLNQEQALKMLPPQQRNIYQEYLSASDPALHSQQVASMINGEKTFLFEGKIYSIKGIKLDPAKVIASEMGKKLGITVDHNRYRGMETAYLSSRAHALKNNFPYFEHSKQVLDTYTGKNIASPFRSKASVNDVKLEKERRQIYQHLSDEEVIANFHRDQPASKDCQYYALVDKKQALLKIKNKAGKEVFATEVLIGLKPSDKRTLFMNYGEAIRETNQSTGAGVFTVGAQKSGANYYRDNFNNNLFSLNDPKGNEMVLALHQVPNGMLSRYFLFNTGDPRDRRVSGGCVNLRATDFSRIKQWIGPSCKVYVLPEEEGNHFVLKNNQINFVSDKKIPAQELGLYHFNPSKISQEISINITHPNGDTPESRVFIKTLATEKQKIMRIFNIDNDDYNDLAILAYGIMGNESEFGKNWRYDVKESIPGIIPYLKAVKSYSSLFLEIPPSIVTSLIIADATNGPSSKTSRGFTQIKFLPEGELKKHYPEISKASLNNPRHAAIATMAYLIDAIHSMKRIAEKNKSDPHKIKISRENMVELLAYIYIGRSGNLTSASNPATPDMNKYIQKLRQNMSYIEVHQKIE
jgi:hypothetical protein